MGNTSATLLIQKKGRLNATARGISAALGAVGCAGEEATLYRRESDRFYILCGAEPYPGPGGDALYALADACAQNLGNCALSVEEYDSDVAILRLTDGQTASAIAFGLVESELLEELEREPYQEALWKPLFPTKRGWAAFEQLRSQQARLPETLESDDFDAFFAEEAIHTIAEALKFDAEAARGFAEESDAEAVWRWPEEAKAGKRDLWMPEDAPPALVEISRDSCNPLNLSFISTGGRCRGLEVLILPRGFSAEDYTIPEVLFQRVEEKGFRRIFSIAQTRTVQTEQGLGWSVLFPDVDIPTGLRECDLKKHFRKIMDTVANLVLMFPVHSRRQPLPHLQFPEKSGITVRLPNGECREMRRDSLGRGYVRVGDTWRFLPYIEVRVWPLKNGERQEGFQTPIALFTTEQGESVALQQYRAQCELLKAEAQIHENVTQA